jgi:hypothetical protein
MPVPYEIEYRASPLCDLHILYLQMQCPPSRPKIIILFLDEILLGKLIFQLTNTVIGLKLLCKYYEFYSVDDVV